MLQSFFGLGDLIDPSAGVFKLIMQVLLYTIIYTGVIVLFTMLAAFIYNTLINFGMKGIRISLAEVEDSNTQEPAQEEETSASVQEENK